MPGCGGASGSSKTRTSSGGRSPFSVPWNDWSPPVLRIRKPWAPREYMSSVWASTSHSRKPSPDCVVAAGPAVAGWLFQFTSSRCHSDATRSASSVAPSVADEECSRSVAPTSRQPGGAEGGGKGTGGCPPAATLRIESAPKLVVGELCEIQVSKSAVTGRSVRPAQGCGSPPSGGSSDSYAPTSEARKNGRTTPRWSTGRQTTSSSQCARSWAGLPARIACVWVRPPLSASAPSRGFVPGWSLSSRSWQVSPLSMFPPSEVIVPAQLPPVGLFATIVLARKTRPSPMRSPPPLLMPPPEAAVLLVTVLLRSVSRDDTSTPPPNWAARLVETVVFSTVVSPSPSLNTPPPFSAKFPDRVLCITSSGASPTWWIAPPIADVLPLIVVVLMESSPSPRLSMPPPCPLALLSRTRESSSAAVSPMPISLSPA